MLNAEGKWKSDQGDLHPRPRQRGRESFQQLNIYSQAKTNKQTKNLKEFFLPIWISAAETTGVEAGTYPLSRIYEFLT